MQWMGLYLSFHLSRVLGPSVHGRLQNHKTSEDTFGHDITPLIAEQFRQKRGLSQHPSWIPDKTLVKYYLQAPDVTSNTTPFTTMYNGLLS